MAFFLRECGYNGDCRAGIIGGYQPPTPLDCQGEIFPFCQGCAEPRFNPPGQQIVEVGLARAWRPIHEAGTVKVFRWIPALIEQKSVGVEAVQTITVGILRVNVLQELCVETVKDTALSQTMPFHAVDDFDHTLVAKGSARTRLDNPLTPD